MGLNSHKTTPSQFFTMTQVKWDWDFYNAFLNYILAITMNSLLLTKACRQWLSLSYVCSRAALLSHSVPLCFCFLLHYNCPNSLVHLLCWCKTCWLLIILVTGHSQQGSGWDWIKKKKKTLIRGETAVLSRREGFKQCVNKASAGRYQMLAGFRDMEV